MNSSLQDISDPVYPDLPTVLDPARMTDIVRGVTRQLGADHEVLGAKIKDVNYDPGQRCNLLFQFKVRRPDGGKTRRQMMTVRLLKTGEDSPSPPEPGEVRRFEEAHASYLPGPYFLVRQPRMVLSTFPYDPDMPWMVEGLDSQRMRRRLSRLWAPEGAKAARVRVNLMGYTPRMRASMHYHVLRLDRETGEREKVELIGKTNAFKKAGKLFADSHALWEASGRKFPMPRPAGYLSAPRLTLQECIAGERLGGLVKAPGFQDRVGETATALAQLHRLRFPVNARRRARDEIRSLQRWGDVVARIRSDLRSRVDPFLARLSAEIENRTEMRCAIHADFHHTNILVDGERIHIIDFDEMACGDPAVDVGRFLASLRIPTLRAFGNIHALDETREVFLETYLRENPGPVGKIRLFEAASLITSAASAFRIQRANWDEEVSLLLDEAERTFAEASRATSPVAGNDSGPNLRWNERIRWARDPSYVQGVVDHKVFEAHGVNLDGCERLREVDSSKAFTARFRLSGSRDEERWRSAISVTLSKRKGGYTAHSLLEEHYPLVEREPASLRPPRPLAYLLRLSAAVTESCRGRGLHTLEPGEELRSALTLVGRGLALWHAGTSADERRDLDRGLRRPSRRIYRKPRDEDFDAIVKEAASRLREDERCSLRLLHHVRLHDVVVADGVAGIEILLALYYADSRHDVAAFLAAWRVHGMSTGDHAVCEEAIGTFLESYQEAAEEPLTDLAPFEALALADRAYQIRGSAGERTNLLSLAQASLSDA